MNCSKTRWSSVVSTRRNSRRKAWPEDKTAAAAVRHSSRHSAGDRDRSGRYEMKAGERFLIQSAGGGGFGAPRDRDAAALACDVGEGFVSTRPQRNSMARSSDLFREKKHGECRLWSEGSGRDHRRGTDGPAMVKHMIKHGYSVTACDINADNLQQAREMGAKVGSVARSARPRRVLRHPRRRL